MKLTKSQLREIIEDELRKDALQEDYEEEEGEEEDIEVEEEKEYVLEPDAPVDKLWKHLNFLLEDWEDKAHPYYEDLLSTVKDFSVGGLYASKKEEIPHLQAEVPGIQERSGLEQSIEALVQEELEKELEERKKKRSVKSERRTRGRSARQK